MNMLEWNWDEKCGEAVSVETFKGVEAEHTYNLYTGNAYMIFINEWTEPDATERYAVCSFWLDKNHMKNCLGLNKKGGYTRNIHSNFRRFRLNKAKCRHWKQIVQALAEAYDDVEIELYTEKEKEKENVEKTEMIDMNKLDEMTLHDDEMEQEEDYIQTHNNDIDLDAR